MAKKKPKVIKNAAKTPEVLPNKNFNGALVESIMGFQPGSIGTQLNQADTLFINNRWYLISNMRQLLSEIYAENGLVRTIIDVPVNDGLRGGIEIKSKLLSPEEIEDLQVEVKAAKDLRIFGQTLKWDRLYGGAGTLIITGQDPSTPLNVAELKPDSPFALRAVDMWELFWDKQNVEDFNAQFQEINFEHYNYYGKKVHKSRVIITKGIEAPSFVRPRLRGWGLSVMESLVNSINSYLKSNNLVFEVLDEFKIDVYKLKNLSDALLRSDGSDKVRRRVHDTNAIKNFMHAIVLDGEDDYAQKQLTFTGLAEMYKEFRMQIACDMRMPISKIFGISATGFSSGEDDIENYNGMIESDIRSKAEPDILKIIQLRCQRKFGYIPEDLAISFKPLRTLSAEQEENVKTQKFNRIFQAWQAGAIDGQAFQDACNRDNLLSVQVDSAPDAQDLAEDASLEDGDSEEKVPAEKGIDKKPKTEPKKAPEAKT